MRNYQIKKNDPYILPRSLYMRVLYTIRDYDRLVQERGEVMYSTPSNDGLPRGSSPGKPTEAKAEKLAQIDTELKAIEQALIKIPPEYRKGVFDNVRYGGWPVDTPAHRNTWSKWRKRFIVWTAQNLNML